MTLLRSASYRYEAQAWRTGVFRVAGVDEAGRGPLAGPVVAAAVVLDPERRLKGLRDSKLLAPADREELFGRISERAVAIGVGVVDHETIDRINILRATEQAMLHALGQLSLAPDLVITDFVRLAVLACPQRNLVNGDGRCATVAAASIGAKASSSPSRTKIEVNDGHHSRHPLHAPGPLLLVARRVQYQKSPRAGARLPAGAGSRPGPVGADGAHPARPERAAGSRLPGHHSADPRTLRADPSGRAPGHALRGERPDLLRDHGWGRDPVGRRGDRVGRGRRLLSPR